MSVIATLRVKNEARWIEEVVNSLWPVCENIFVLDDHSEDDTVRLAQKAKATVFHSPFKGLDEARDKDYLLRRVEDYHKAGTWVLMIDGDEVLAHESVPEVKRLAAESACESYSFKILYLWNDHDHIRTDGVYGHFRRPSMFVLRPGATFMHNSNGGNFHCGSVPTKYFNRCGAASVALLHMGYMDAADRIRKYFWYNSIDPNNPNEDGYRHMVVGDLFPEESAFRHGGPLKLEALKCSTLAA